MVTDQTRLATLEVEHPVTRHPSPVTRPPSPVTRKNICSNLPKHRALSYVMEAKDRIWGALAAAIYLLIIALAFIPGTRATVRDHVRYLRGDWYSREMYWNPGGKYFYFT